MKFLAALLLVVSTTAFGAANDLVLNQRNSTDTGSFNRFPTVPVSGTGVLSFNTGTILPEWLTLGTTLSVTGTTLDVVSSSRTFNYPARSLNSCFQPSATKDASVQYAVDISSTISLTSGQQGTVFLETFTNSGCTLGTQEINRFSNGNTGTLTIGLNLTQIVTGTVSGWVQAGLWAKLRTQNDTGTPTFTYRSAQEVLQ